MGLISSVLEYLLVGVESSYGVDPTPTEAICLVAAPTVTVNQVPVNSLCRRAYYGGHRHSNINDKITYSMQVEVGGLELVDGGTPAIHALLLAAGHTAALTGTAAGSDLKAEYKPSSIGHGSCAMHLRFRDKDTGEYIRLKLLGARHNISFSVSINSKLTATIEGEALYAEWEPSASATAPTAYNKGIAALLNTNIAMSWNSRDYDTNAFAFATGWALQNLSNVTGSSQLTEIYLSLDPNTRPSGSFNPPARAADFAATGSLKADARAATEATLSMKVITGSHGFEVRSATAQLGTTGMSADAAHYRFDQPFMCNPGSGNDDYSLIFTQET